MIYTLTLNPALDKTVMVDVLNINQISRVQEMTIEAGGKGFNVSRALLRAGLKNKALGLVGGRTGGQLVDDLVNDGLDVIPIPIHGETRVNQVFLESSSRSVKVNERGPIISESEYHLLFEEVKKLSQSEDIWVLSGSLPPNVPFTVYADLITIIHEWGGKVFLDSSGQAFQEGLNVKPDWIKPNLVEAREIFSGGLNELDLLEQFRELGVGGTILTLGSRGLLFASASTCLRVIVPHIDNENVVGAGDATVAGFVYGVAKGSSEVECAKWAAAVGVAAAHAAGNCFDAFAQVEEFYTKLKVEVL